MTVPISPRTLAVFLACGAILPVAAFFAAMPTQKGKAKTLNVLGVVIGVVAISIIGFELYQNR